MTSLLSLTQLEQLGWTIERSGLADVPEQQLLHIAHEAIRLGIRPIAANVLADPTVPSAVRQRAFGHVATGLATMLHSDLGLRDPNRQFATVA